MGEDPLPFEEVYRRYADGVFRFCVVQLSDRQAAEDVTADVFVNAFTAYGRVRPDPETVQFWLFRIARNLSINHLRRGGRYRNVLRVLHRSHEDTTDAAAMAEMRDEFDRALAAVGSLKPRDRTLISLQVGAGMSFAEIGAVVGMTEMAASAATRRALKRTQAALEQQK